jgi:hemin uptake protein HemP
MITVLDSRRVGENIIPTATVTEGIWYSLQCTDIGDLTGAALATSNQGNITCMASSEAVTKLGKIYILDHDGAWYELGVTP